MTGSEVRRRRALWCGGGALLVLGNLAGCGAPGPERIQGYVEGEYVYVAAPLAGAVEALHVQRGAQVKAGDRLFALESTREQAAQREAKWRLAQARASLEDAMKGKRPSEIKALEAQIDDAEAALANSERELARLRKLRTSRAAADEEFDRARTRRDRDAERVTQMKADLTTARLGARADQIDAARAEVRAREAALARAEWELAEMRQAAPQAGVVFDTLYRKGEWVAAGRPVVALLPPEYVKVRAFLPEGRVAAIQHGAPARVTLDGAAGPFVGSVSFISPRAEFTPPVIYSRESRAKLVFMIEITFDRQTAAKLHPGQPVDVELGP